MSDYEISKLKKQLQRKNQLLKEEKEDRQFTEQQLVQVQAERDKYHGQLMIARQAIENVDQIIAQNVREMKAKIQQENAASLNQLQNLRDRLMEEQHFNQKLKEQTRNKDTVISDLSARLRELSLKHKDQSYLISTRQVTQQAMITHNQFYKLTQKYNRLSQDMQNIMAQNKILRKLHGVPDNFGFDLEEIKIAQKQELQDYKAQCRKLEAEIQELEAERTQLRYRLRQYNTLYSNKGQRYKDLTQRQLEQLDTYALNLKEGRIQLPQIDKSQKQMEKQIIKLRAKVQVLQNRGQVIVPPRKDSTETTNTGDRISDQSMRKFQEQIRQMLEPFVQDIKKLSESNLTSLIQNLQNIQVRQDGQPGQQQYIPSSTGTNFHPPQPLPIAHNDWSKIKEGYSYKYSSKIPVDLKDYENDIGFDQLKAKYEIAALQLQNIESLKMLKQKQDQQNLLLSQLKQLKQKYAKCLKIQDDLFVRYFTEKEQQKQKFKKTQIQKKRAENQRDEARTELQVLRNAFNTLSIKTDLQQRYKQFAERLAKSQAGLIKTQRKYQIIHDQQINLRQAYTKLQLKASQNEFILKQKLLSARGHEKQLTMLMNQVLEQTRNSVSSDTHNILLSKMEILNDKSAAFAFKQSQLRLKIARLQSVQRQMNIKDQVIQHLRQDKLDLMLELEIIRHRLQAVDPAYKSCQQNFKRLVSFVNQNNISIMNAFKKFDRDNSATLTKDELKSALATLGFKVSKEQFQLLFAQFDLDGSQSVTYQQFTRKLRRGGVNSRSKQEQGIYLFFKAIKQANISIKKAFQIIDMDGSNTVTQSQMQTAFRKIGIDCDSKTIESVFRICDQNMDGQIGCSQLQNLYHDIIKETEIDEMEFKAQLDWKYKFILMIEDSSIKNKMTLQETFKELDQDGNSYLTMTQLSGLLSRSGVSLERKYMNQLFKFLDMKYDNKVEYSQFLRKLDEAKKQKKRIERLQSVKRRAQQLRKENAAFESQRQNTSERNITQASLNVRLMALESKQSNLVKKNQKICKNLAQKQQKVKDLEKQVEETQDSYEKARSQYHAILQQNTVWQQKMKNYIGEFEAKKMKEEIAKLKINNSEIIPQLDTYKGYYSALHDKNKADLMGIEKLKAELNKYYQIVKDLQSQHPDKAKLGHLAIELQYSKRNEEQTNKKYQDIIQKVKNTEKDNVNLSSEVFEKQKQMVNVHLAMMEKSNLLQKKIDTLTSKILPTVSITKIDEFVSKLRTISNSKSQLQEHNKALKEKNFNLQLRNDYIENQRVHLQELEKRLRRNYTDDNSTAIIDLTKKLSDYKMGELKAKRQHNLLKQKQEYYMRINNANTDNIKQLQEQLAKWDIKYNERQQFWRKRMADQMKLLEDIQREAAKVKESQRKAQQYFSDKAQQEQKYEQDIQRMQPQRSSTLKSIVQRAPVGRDDSEKVESLRNQITDLTLALQHKQKQIYQLKTTLQELVPEQKLRFSSIGSQMGAPTNSFILQTDLTTSQLNNNAKRFLSAQKDQQAFYKQEAQRMVQAAQQSIDTLQRIIDQKNIQIKKKDNIIDQLKRTMLKRQDEDCFQIQKLNQQIRQLRSNRQIASLNHLMERPTRKQFYQHDDGESKIKSLMEMIDDKDREAKSWQNKYNELFLKKSKDKPINSQNTKVIEVKLKQLQDQRDYQKKKYSQTENKLNEKIKNLQKVSKDKDKKLAQLHKTIVQLKDGILQEKMDLAKQQNPNNDQFIENMNRGTNPNDSRMEAMLQKAMETIKVLQKKNRDLQKDIKIVRDQNRLTRTMQKNR